MRRRERVRKRGRIGSKFLCQFFGLGTFVQSFSDQIRVNWIGEGLPRLPGNPQSPSETKGYRSGHRGFPTWRKLSHQHSIARTAACFACLHGVHWSHSVRTWTCARSVSLLCVRDVPQVPLLAAAGGSNRQPEHSARSSQRADVANTPIAVPSSRRCHSPLTVTPHPRSARTEGTEKALRFR